MGTIYNTELINELINAVRLQQGRENIPSKFADTIVPTVETNPKLLKHVNIFKSRMEDTNNVFIIYTTPTDKDFYLTYASLIVTQPATTTNTLTDITAILESGLTVKIVTTPKVTTSSRANPAMNKYESAFAIKLKRGTTIILTNTFSAGECIASATIGGYTLETDKK